MKLRKRKANEADLLQNKASAPRPTRRRKPATLKTSRITEDEADLIIALRRKNDPGIPFDQVLAEHGYQLDD